MTSPGISRSHASPGSIGARDSADCWEWGFLWTWLQTAKRFVAFPMPETNEEKIPSASLSVDFFRTTTDQEKIS